VAGLASGDVTGGPACASLRILVSLLYFEFAFFSFLLPSARGLHSSAFQLNLSRS